MSSGTAAHFQTVPFSKLISRDSSAISTLLSAATKEGFFYLDLTDVPILSVLQDVSDLKLTSEALFDLPMAEKMLYDTNELGTLKNYGYKPIGRNTGVVHGKRDGHELYLIPRDILFGLSQSDKLKGPEVLLHKAHILKRFAEESHRICLTILDELAMAVGVRSITDCHRENYSSTSAMALLKYPKLEVDDDLAGHISHTDVGSLTLLFCDQDGLQAMHPTSGKWEKLTPRPGFAVVNIGDSLHHLSKRMLRSAFHRVVPYSEGCDDARYSIIYFLRPEQTAKFVDENEREWKSIDWHVRKFNAFRAKNPTEVQKILDGRV